MEIPSGNALPSAPAEAQLQIARAAEAEHATSSSRRAGLRRGFGEEQKSEARWARAGEVIARAASVNCKHRKQASLLSACDLLAKAAKRGDCSFWCSKSRVITGI